jgi:integrase
LLEGGTEAIIWSVAPRRQVQSWRREWRKVLKDTGLQYRWHDLLHTFITRLAENPNISEETIRSLAGHVSEGNASEVLAHSSSGQARGDRPS